MRAEIDTIKDIWSDRFPRRSPRRHLLIEKLLFTPLVVSQILSLSALRPSKPDNIRHSWMDLYVLTWAVVLTVVLFAMPVSWHAGAVIAIILSGYRIFDIIAYRLYFVFVKSQEKPWTLEILRRSILIVSINFAETTVAFAAVHWFLGGISGPGGRSIETPLAAIYYSLTTMTTLGYGDFFPATDAGRTIVIVQLCASLTLLLFVIPALISLFASNIGDMDAHAADNLP